MGFVKEKQGCVNSFCRNLNSQTILKNKNQVGGLALPNLKIYSKATLIKTVKYCCKGVTEGTYCMDHWVLHANKESWTLYQKRMMYCMVVYITQLKHVFKKGQTSKSMELRAQK